MVLTVLFALLTATANAVAVATQHVASTSHDQTLSKWRLVLSLLRHPLWLFGWVALTGSLLFQALALHFGPLSVVQPLLVSELVIALVLRRAWIRQSIRTTTWVAATVTTCALALFLVTSAPSGSPLSPSPSTWRAAVLVGLALTALLVISARTGSPSRRAGLYAGATAVMWALEATFIKATTDVIAQHGFSAAISRWPLYALIIGGVAGLLCEQAALHVGPLKISQPVIVIVDPIVSIILGAWIFDEHLHLGVAHLTASAIAFAAMCAGVVVMTRTAPPTMTADVHRI